MTDTPQRHSLWKTVRRATCGRCPNCGDGKLFRSYLKQVEACAVCGEAYGHIRADDGPAWLTIVIVTHVLATLTVMVMNGNTWPEWLVLLVILTPTILLMALLLPRTKGLFIGCIWRSGCTGSER